MLNWSKLRSLHWEDELQVFVNRHNLSVLRTYAGVSALHIKSSSFRNLGLFHSVRNWELSRWHISWLYPTSSLYRSSFLLENTHPLIHRCYPLLLVSDNPHPLTHGCYPLLLLFWQTHTHGCFPLLLVFRQPAPIHPWVLPATVTFLTTHTHGCYPLLLVFRQPALTHPRLLHNMVVFWQPTPTHHRCYPLLLVFRQPTPTGVTHCCYFSDTHTPTGVTRYC